MAVMKFRALLLLAVAVQPWLVDGQQQFADCGTTRVCFPAQCPADGCAVRMSYRSVDTQWMQIELYRRSPTPTDYVALGVSDDDKMGGCSVYPEAELQGDDMVMTCTATEVFLARTANDYSGAPRLPLVS